MLLQICRYILDQVEIHMGVVKAHTWKELVEQAEIAEKSAKSLNRQYLKRGVNNKGRSEMAQSSQEKEKETTSMELSGEAPPKTKKIGTSNQEFKFPPKQYSFKDEQVVTIFHLLQKGNKLKLPEV